MSGLEIEVRRKAFPAAGRAAAHVALEQVRFTIGAGELVCLLGPSGCGKTTLLNIVAGLDRDFSGRVAPAEGADGGTARVGYVFQNPRLLPWRTVAENVRLALAPGQTAGRVEDLLAMMGLAGFADVYPQRLSVGMARRVALARALAVEPDLLLLDEPFVSLDEPTAHRLREALLALRRRRPITVLLVSHDTREALLLADRLILLSPAPGRVVADLPVELPRDSCRDDAVEPLRTSLIERYPDVFQNR
jgi:ABC-type nitrate/sulfonate/bicarbonate transport system ATPase subunit